MHPIVWDFGTWDLPLFGETHLFLPSYGALFAASVLLGWLWFVRRARGMGLPEDRLFNLGFYSLLAGILGAKLLLVLVDLRWYFSHPDDLLSTLRAGGVLAGGVVAGALTFALYARRHGLPTLRMADAIAAPIALAQGIGRLGCFAAGCCWGRTLGADHPLAVTFTDPKAHELTGVPLHQHLFPTQPIQMAHDLTLCVFLAWLWRRKPRPDGTVFWAYVALYGLGRGVIEFWRGDAHRGLYLDGALSTTQIVVLIAMLIAVGMLVRGRLRQRHPANG